MKKGDVQRGIVKRVDFPGKGIVECDNQTAVIKNVVPGEEVEFMVSKKRNGYLEGRLLSVVKKSPEEIESPCPHFEFCGGCTYMNLPYEEQLKIKEGQIKRLLDSVLFRQEDEYVFESIKGSPRAYEYRNKMEFSFGDSYMGGPLALGMHKRGSFYDVEKVSDCRIVDEDYRKVLNSTCDYFEGTSFYHKMKHTGYLRHLLVRKGTKTGEMLVGLVTSSQYDKLGISEDEYLNGWKEEMLKLDLTNGTICGILHIVNDALSDVVQSDRTDILYGRDTIDEELLGLRFHISPFSFFQTNSLGAEVLYETARNYIGDVSVNGKKDAVLFDLYSGTGTIAQLMAPVCKKVYGVEIVEEAVLKARENAQLNGLDNCEFIAGDVLEVLDNIDVRPDFVILDPPRDGVNPKALKKIIDYGVSKLIYISCKPTSLVRDLESFLLAGYKVERACAVDMFPNTANCETVCLLVNQNAKAKQHVNVGIDAEEYYKIKNS